MYTSGKYIVLAKRLSLAPSTCQSHEMSSTEVDVDMRVNLVVGTAKYPILHNVIANLNNEWVKGFCPQFYNVRAELSVANRVAVAQMVEQVVH